MQNNRRKGQGSPPLLVARLLSNILVGTDRWGNAIFESPPAINVEAADELRRLENQNRLFLSFLQAKGLLIEFARTHSPEALARANLEKLRSSNGSENR